MEVHDNPAQAKSDGANALQLSKLPGVLSELLGIQNALQEDITDEEIGAASAALFELLDKEER
jgi:3-deoxy-D-manno-octulosonic acid (KDO) 8-phosphate synthase